MKQMKKKKRSVHKLLLLVVERLQKEATLAIPSISNHCPDFTGTLTFLPDLNPYFINHPCILTGEKVRKSVRSRQFWCTRVE